MRAAAGKARGSGREKLEKASDFLLLGLLGVFCSLPVLTAGAAFRACYACGLHLLRDDEGTLFKNYFSEFRAEFGKSTALWLFLLVLLGLAAGSGQLYFRLIADETFRTAVSGFCGILFLSVLFLSVFLFPLCADFALGFSDALMTSAYTGLQHPLRTLLLILLDAAVILAVIRLPFFIVPAPGVLLYVNCRILAPVLDELAAEEGETGEKVFDRDFSSV